MSMPKGSWKAITTATIVAFVIIYLSFAFVQDSWNMFDWGKETKDQQDIRVTFVVAQLMFTGSTTLIATVIKWKP